MAWRKRLKRLFMIFSANRDNRIFRIFIWGLFIGFFLLDINIALCSSSLRKTPVVIAVQKASPSVVNISTIVKERIPGLFPFPGDEFFKDFFPELFPGEYQRVSLGSGVIIDSKKGLIVTNHHVVEKAIDIKVVTSDGREFHASIVGTDPRSDIALLKVKNAKGLHEIKMGNSDDIMIGETVIAIGNPFGLSHTVTTGVVSAIDRTVRTENQVYRHFIQTDASINPGNSGGPLLNIEGKLIGINTAIYQKAQGIGFAIPVNKVKKVVKELLRAGEVRFPWIGIEIQPLTPSLMEHFGFKSKRQGGVLINNVIKGSPAQKAGIKRGDILITIDGEKLYSVDEYREYLSDYMPEDKIEMKLFRKGKILKVIVKAGIFPPEFSIDYFYMHLGIRVDSIGMAERFSTGTKEGIIIRDIRPGSEAQRIGLRVGDIILKINGIKISSLEDFKKIISRYFYLPSIRLVVKRGQFAYSITLPF